MCFCSNISFIDTVKCYKNYETARKVTELLKKVTDDPEKVTEMTDGPPPTMEALYILCQNYGVVSFPIVAKYANIFSIVHSRLTSTVCLSTYSCLIEGLQVQAKNCKEHWQSLYRCKGLKQ